MLHSKRDMETPSQVEDAMQQGRGELTPAAITRAVQNLADNPLAARMHGSKLLSATQVADTSAMSQLNYAPRTAETARTGVCASPTRPR